MRNMNNNNRNWMPSLLLPPSPNDDFNIEYYYRPSFARIFEKQCQQIISMAIPIIQTSIITLLFIFSLHMKKEGSKPFKDLMPYVEPSVHTEKDALDIFLGSIFNAFYILLYVVFVTFLFLYIYKKQYQKIGFGIIFTAFFVAEFGFLLYWFIRIVEIYHLNLSYVTVIFAVYNIVVGGIVCVFYKTLHLTLDYNHKELIDNNEYYSKIMNLYLLINSIALGWPFACFGEWTVISIMVLLIIWDLFAVLSKYGPLGMIMSIRKQRLINGEKDFKMPPSLIYHTRFFDLGTGDILFYSVCIGRAALLSYTNAITCTLSIIFGVSLTIIVTINSSRVAIPALPIALLLGILTISLTYTCFEKYLNVMIVENGYYI